VADQEKIPDSSARISRLDGDSLEMTSDRWRRVADLYEAVLEKAPADREAFLRESCGADPQLRDEVESLLSQDRHDSPLDRPIWVSDTLANERPALATGTTVGSYRIVGLIGEGGMGQVYRAQDTKLPREVALKILPDAFVHDLDRLARFRQEAHVLASLNHPNIATIYGFEDSEAVHALVLELVEGPTLADRIAEGAIPIDEALHIAKQIAEALETAHEQGIIHRDLKPANIKVRPDGTVKVLDFGLAKALEPMAAPGAGATASPTITSPAMMTGVGVLLGTAAYMSPEHARGKAVDRRTDIWAFGCVLYEMLAGKRAFGGETVSETLAGVMKTEPRWSALPSETPAALRNVVRRCLEKDPRQRMRDIGDVRLALEGAFETAAVRAGQGEAVVALPLWRRALPLVMAIVTVSVVTGVGVWSVTRSEPSSPAVSRFVITPPASAALTQLGGWDVIISPDGRRIVYVGEDAKRGRLLFVRDIDALEGRAVPGTEGASDPFFSPDGAWIGFERGTVLVKVAASGGPPVEIVDTGVNPTGGAWGVDNTVIFAKNDGLYKVSAAGGGSVERLTSKADAADAISGYIAPRVLPGGKAVVFYLRKGADWASDRLAVLSLETGEQKILIGGGSPLYASSGHLLFARGTTLMAAPFDLKRLQVTGDPVALLEGITRTGASTLQYDLSKNGTLVYRPGTGTAGGRTLAWVGRDGREEAISMEPGTYADWRVSPDGGRIAVWASGDIWIHDVARRTTTRLTFDPSADIWPLWTPDGERVVFASNRSGNFDLYWKRADGTGPEERLTTGSQHEFPESWGNGGRDLVFMECQSAQMCDVSVLSMAGERQTKVLLQTKFNEQNAAVSPDGRWLAYDSNESGQPEIYVRPFPDVEGGRWQLSTAGGTEPLWGPKGDELFYRTPTSMMVVPVRAGATPTFGNAATLFNLGRYFIAVGGGRHYDIAPKADRFILTAPVAPEGDAAGQIVVVQGWFEELKRLVSTK
jgi:eukaryotic-like serine/threonine-protein kinase